ncbi:MAG: conjugal transfer protein TraF [Planctomycetes bacterium]|nr:conjugal transfer protein TraF [Planctomycetota bacterium]
MTRLALLIVAVVAIASSLHAEEWVDFNSRVVGMGGAGAILGRGASGIRYNPANAASRPWERGDVEILPLSFEFSISAGLSAAFHGDDFNTMFEIVDAANEVQDRFQDGAFDTPTTASLSDYRDVFGIFNKLDLLDSLSGDGIYANSYAGVSARVGNLFFDGDGLGVTFGGFGIGGAAVLVDLDSLRNYRFTDESGATWDTFITAAATLSGQPTAAPSSSGGQQFSADLQAAGYPVSEANILAKTAEDAGINFGGVGASILFDFLVNTRNGTGQSLESGADPLEGNQSGFVIRGMSFYEVGVSYGMPLPIPVVGDWLSIGATVRFIQAYTFSHTLFVEDMDSNGVEDTLANLGEQVSDAYTLKGDASRFNVGVDLGITFTPQLPIIDTLAITLVGRNLNGPEFRWDPAYGNEPKLIRFDPQFAMGASYTLFDSIGLPLTFAVEGELNRISSDVLPRYHTQFIRGGIGWEPSFGGFGFGLRIGGFKNIADAGQAFTLTAGAGLKLWFFHLETGLQVGLDNQKFGTDGDNRVIPHRFAIAIELGIDIDF